MDCSRECHGYMHACMIVQAKSPFHDLLRVSVSSAPGTHCSPEGCEDALAKYSEHIKEYRELAERLKGEVKVFTHVGY